MSILPRARKGHTMRIWDYPFRLPLVVAFDREGTIYVPNTARCTYRGPLVSLIWRGGVYNMPNTLKRATIRIRCPHVTWSFVGRHGYSRWATLVYKASNRFYMKVMMHPEWYRKVFG